MVVRNGVERGREVSKGGIGVGEMDGGEGGSSEADSESSAGRSPSKTAGRWRLWLDVSCAGPPDPAYATTLEPRFGFFDEQ